MTSSCSTCSREASPGVGPTTVVRGFFVDVLDKVTDADLRRDVIRRIERIGMDGSSNS